MCNKATKYTFNFPKEVTKDIELFHNVYSFRSVVPKVWGQ